MLAHFWERLVITGLYLASAAYAVWLGFTQPFMNWDIIAYVGTVLSWQHPDAKELYKVTGGLLKAELPDWVYAQVWGSELTKDPKAFLQQLPFYKVKPLYTGGIWLLHELGITLTRASWILSALSMAGLSLVLLLFRPAKLKALWLLGIIALFWLGPWPLADLARFSTPDALALFLVMAAALSWLKWKSWIAFAVLGVLATTARSDCMLMIAALGLLSMLPFSGDRRLKPWQSVAVIGAAITTYVAVNTMMGGYGWERLFVYNFLEKVPYPADMTRELTLADYWGTLKWNLTLLMKEMRFWCFVALSLIAFAFYCARPDGSRLWIALLAFMWLAYIARFLMFPAAQEYRYYYGFYLLMLLASLQMIAPYVEAKLVRRISSAS